MKHLSIEETLYWTGFLSDFIVAVEQVRVASSVLSPAGTRLFRPTGIMPIFKAL